MVYLYKHCKTYAVTLVPTNIASHNHTMLHSSAAPKSGNLTLNHIILTHRNMADTLGTWLTHLWHGWHICDMADTSTTWLTHLWHGWHIYDMADTSVTLLTHDMADTSVTWLTHTPVTCVPFAKRHFLKKSLNEEAVLVVDMTEKQRAWLLEAVTTLTRNRAR